MKLNRMTWVMLAVALLGTSTGWARVQVKERSQFSMGGVMGKFAGMLGGKAAKEGLVRTISVDGARKMTISDDTGELIDLDQERIYQIDFKRKSYKVVSFAEMKKQLEDLNQKLGKGTGQDSRDSRKPAKEYEVDFKLEETGQSKNVVGFAAHEVRMIITVREKGSTLEDGGGMVMTSDMWLSDEAEAVKEIQAFDRLYAERLYGDLGAGAGAGQFAAAMAMYPAMMKAMEKMQAEDVKVQGASLANTVTFESVQSRKQMQEQASGKEEDDSAPPSLGGLLGGLGRRMGGKRNDSAPPKNPGRETVLSTTQEILSVSADFGTDQLEIPVDFKEKR